MADVTNDGSAELLFSYYPGNDSVGVFYQRQPSGAWDVILEDRALDALPDGSVVSYIETCVPNCASGPQIEVRHVWNGMSFDSQTYDGFGNPVDIYIRTGCVGDYNPRDYAPLRKCDKGLVVEQLQAALLYYGFLITSDAEPPAVDGYFGKDTDTSVRLYQLAAGVPVTGVVEGQWYYELIENYNLMTGGY